MVAGVLSGWPKSDEVDVKDRNIWYEDDLNIRKVREVEEMANEEMRKLKSENQLV